MYNEKLRDDVSNVFKNEMFIEFLDWIVEKDYITTELYYVGWCGEKAFYNKFDNYVEKLRNLGYIIEVEKDIYDENNGVYAQLYFNFN